MIPTPERPGRGDCRRRRCLVGLLAVGALALGACSAADDQAERSAEAAPAATTSSSIGEGAAVPSAGCQADAERVAAGLSRERLAFGGVDREYRRFVPDGYEPTTPAPLVLDIHGLTMSDDMEAAVTGMEPLADDEGFLVVTPQGLGDIPFWNFISAGVATDDVSFLRELVIQVGEDLCVDTSRVYATGISNGGLMSSALACRLPDVFAAVAPVAGVTFLDGCEEGPPVSYQAVYGTADNVLPYDGGLGGPIRGFLSSNPLDASEADPEEQESQISSIAFPPVDDALAQWAERNGCAVEPDEERVSDEVVRRAWPDCEGGAEVVLFVVEGGGHSWPGTPLFDGDAATQADTSAGGLASVAGTTTMDISATELAWEFFQRHQLDP
ncbi:MAG: prolyl oligopeptidase family serine peptidase [Acidimicrobiales bacterium]|nr:prolyl oligopeptidase family serine peptidase [Acidimicrobiales bacterium]